jgi:hypothetical protein
MQLATWSKRTSTRAISKSGEHCAGETKSRHAVKRDGFLGNAIYLFPQF